MYFLACCFNLSCLPICFKSFSSGVFILNLFKNHTFAILKPALEKSGALNEGAGICLATSKFSTANFACSFEAALNPL